MRTSNLLEKVINHFHKKRKYYQSDKIIISGYKWIFWFLELIVIVGLIFFLSESESNRRTRFLNKLLENLEGIAILSAAHFYIWGRAERREANIFEKFQILDNAQTNKSSFARYYALKFLNQSGISLRGIDLKEAQLENISLRYSDRVNAS